MASQVWYILLQTQDLFSFTQEKGVQDSVIMKENIIPVFEMVRFVIWLKFWKICIFCGATVEHHYFKLSGEKKNSVK